MKILSVSDVVDPKLKESPDDPEFAGVDLILACGDLPPEYLTHLVDRFRVPLYYVKGNHDLRYEGKPPAGCRNIASRVARFKGRNFLGLEGSRWYNGGPNQYTEAQMRREYWRLIPTLWWRRGVDVIIAHAPPRFIHDAEDQCHRGFRVFHRLINRYRPAFFIHGHIHRSFDRPEDRTTLLEQTRVVNTFGHYLFEYENGLGD